MKKLVLFFVILMIGSVSSLVTINFPDASTQIILGNLTNFIQLQDTPASYSGQAGLCAIVNVGEDSLEFGSCGSGTLDGNASSICSDGEVLMGDGYCLGLNATIDDRVVVITDTNLSEWRGNLTDSSCAGQVVVGVLANGSLICETDDTGAGGNYFDQQLNTTDLVSFNQLTIDSAVNDKLIFDGSQSDPFHTFLLRNSKGLRFYDEDLNLGTFIFGNTGNLSVAGNVSADYYFGDGSQLTNLPGGSGNGNTTAEIQAAVNYSIEYIFTANNSRWWGGANESNGTQFNIGIGKLTIDLTWLYNWASSSLDSIFNQTGIISSVNNSVNANNQTTNIEALGFATGSHTIDTDTNESIRFQNLTTYSCSGTDKMVSVQANGTVLCASDETGTGGKRASGRYIYNDSAVIYSNDTQLWDDFVNVTGDTMTGPLNMSDNPIYIDGITLKPLDEKNSEISGPAYGVYMTGPSGQNMPHLIIQSGGSSQASVVLRSQMIVNEIAGFHNTTNATSCTAYMNEVAEVLKIDCNTTTTGADLLVGDDMQVVGDVWLKDTDGEWHFMTRELGLLDELRDETVVSRINSSITDDNLTIIEASAEEIVVNIDEENFFVSSNTSILLTAGTNTTPIFNHIYYEGNPPVLTKATSAQEEKSDIAQILFGGNYTYGSIVSTATGYEFVRKVYHRFFDQGSLYKSGFDISATTTQLNFSEGIMKVLLDDFEIFTNHSTFLMAIEIHQDGTFHQHVNDLDAFDTYATGGSIGNNRYFNLVCGVVSTHDMEGRMYCLIQDEPSSEYTNSIDAETDQNYVNFFPSNEFLSKLFIPVARIVIQRSGGTNTIQTLSNGNLFLDLRGTISGGGSPPTPGITSHPDLSNLDYASSGHTGFLESTLLALQNLLNATGIYNTDNSTYVGQIASINNSVIVNNQTTNIEALGFTQGAHTTDTNWSRTELDKFNYSEGNWSRTQLDAWNETSWVIEQGYTDDVDTNWSASVLNNNYNQTQIIFNANESWSLDTNWSRTELDKFNYSEGNWSRAVLNTFNYSEPNWTRAQLDAWNETAWIIEQGYGVGNTTQEMRDAINGSSVDYVFTSNDTKWWAGSNSTNATWFEVVVGKLTIIPAQLISFIDSWFGTKDTDDLTEGSTNLYEDGRRDNATYVGQIVSINNSVIVNNQTTNIEALGFTQGAHTTDTNWYANQDVNTSANVTFYNVSVQGNLNLSQNMTIAGNNTICFNVACTQWIKGNGSGLFLQG